MGLAKVHCGATPPSVMVLLFMNLQLKMVDQGLPKSKTDFLCVSAHIHEAFCCIAIVNLSWQNHVRLKTDI